MTKNTHIDQLEAIKSTLLIAVILGHVSAVTLPSISELSAHSANVIVILAFKAASAFGREAAYLFVFFSGFATAHHYQQRTRSNAANSTVKRIQRLFPLYIYALAATWVLDSVGYTFAPDYYANNFPFPHIAAKNESTSTLLCNLAMLQPTFCHSYGTNGPLWTIGYLMQFYLVGWVFRAVFPNIKKMAIVGGAIGIFACLALRVEWAALFALWILGLQLRLSQINKTFRAGSFLLSLFVVFGILLAKLGGPFWSMLFMAPVGTAFIFLAERDWPPLHPVIEKVLAWLRGNSFPLYLLHMPILAASAAAMTAAFGPISNRPFAFIALLALTMLFSACLIAFYRRLERIASRSRVDQ